MPKWKKEKAVKMRNKPTPSEEALWHILRKEQLGYKFVRQSCMLGYIADFYCPSLRLVIEVDGPIHNKAYDFKRDRILLENGITTLRFKNEDVFNKAECEKKIYAFIKGL